MDLCSREIVGWSLSKTPIAELAKSALSNAISRKRPDASKLLFHSDQGTQYTANKFAVYCKGLKITRSMRRRGNCWVNAVMERFFRNLKTERINSAIDYLTPNQKYIELQKCG